MLAPDPIRSLLALMVVTSIFGCDGTDGLAARAVRVVEGDTLVVARVSDDVEVTVHLAGITVPKLPAPEAERAKTLVAAITADRNLKITQIEYAGDTTYIAQVWVETPEADEGFLTCIRKSLLWGAPAGKPHCNEADLGVLLTSSGLATLTPRGGYLELYRATQAAQTAGKGVWERKTANKGKQ